jgi:hypothetical protein
MKLNLWPQLMVFEFLAPLNANFFLQFKKIYSPMYFQNQGFSVVFFLLSE